MAINLPDSPKEVEQRAKTDVQRTLPESNPFLKNSFLGATITGYSLRVFDFYTQLEEVTKQLFVQTATGEFLAMFGSWFGITRNPATQSSGRIVATGISTTNIPGGTTYQSSDGLQYITQSAEVLTTSALVVDTLTRSGTTATVTTVGDHQLSSFVNSTIAGAIETQFNGTFSITVTSATEFTYPVPDSGVTTATGAITSTQTTASIEVQSEDFGASTNQLADAALTLTTPIAGVDNTARVDFDELAGGTDTESDEDFRDRIIDRVQNPVALFNVAAIVTQARTVPGVTRVFVFETTSIVGGVPVPEVGAVTVYFTRDNDDDIFPTGPEVDDVKEALLLIKPANTSDNDVDVAAPVKVPVDFTFTELISSSDDDDSSTLQDAVTTSLTELMLSTDVGDDLTEDKYRSAISTTIDRVTGDFVKSFTLQVPVDDVTVTAGELAALGPLGVTYP